MNKLNYFILLLIFILNISFSLTNNTNSVKLLKIINPIFSPINPSYNKTTFILLNQNNKNIKLKIWGCLKSRRLFG